jgi:hypothetical protein
MPAQSDLTVGALSANVHDRPGSLLATLLARADASPHAQRQGPLSACLAVVVTAILGAITHDGR